MIDQLVADMEVRPDLFRWRSAIPAADLDEWVRDTGLRVPPDLLSLWSVTGGGELFETEELLGPLDAPDFSVVARTKFLREIIPPASTVFHEGAWLTLISADGQIMAVHRITGRTRCTYPSLDDWYADLRSEFAERYGLPPNHADKSQT